MPLVAPRTAKSETKLDIFLTQFGGSLTMSLPSGSGVRACALMSTDLASSFAGDHDGPGGPAFLRGGPTCRAVESSLFECLRLELAQPLP
jgi:hypothetical protein